MLWARHQWTNALYWLGEYDTTVEMRKDLLERFRRILGSDHPDTLQVEANLAISASSACGVP